jgi:CheY-like chemotaxis protein
MTTRYGRTDFRAGVVPARPTPDRQLEGVDVLVVDDSPDELELFALILPQWGASVRTMTSADEALAAVRASRPSVLVSDIALGPGRDGYQLIRELRSWPAELGGDLPAVAVTGWCRACDSAAAIDAGFQVHLSKPVPIETLVAVIASLARAQGAAPDVAKPAGDKMTRVVWAEERR